MDKHSLPISIMFLFLTVITSFAVLFYVAQKKLPTLEKLLDKCVWITDTSRAWRNNGMIGKMHLLSIIHGVLLFPNFGYKRNVVDLDQVRSVPKNLKMWVVVPFLAQWAAMGLMIILWLLFADATI